MTDAPQMPGPQVAQMRLRPTPKPVLRLSRKVLISASAVAAVGLASVLALTMAPAKPKTSTKESAETAPRNGPATSEALAGLPKDYTGVPTSVPKLGPPLPGDFGQAALAANGSPPNSTATGPAVSAAPGAVSAAQAGAGASAANTQAQQAEQARTAAHSSHLFFEQSLGLPGIADPTAGTGAETNQVSSLVGALSSATPAEIKTDPDRKASFLDRSSDTQVVSTARLAAPASPYVLSAGSVIPAALITGLRSDIPGQVLAQVTQDVRDSVTGQYLLIPRGSRLIGQYDNAISYGQSRVLLVWNRLILPNGGSLVLEKLSAADAGGYAGLQDKTNFHWAAIVNAAAVSALLGIGAQSGDTENDSALLKAVRDGAGDSINRAGQQIVERQLNVQPTITIRPGLPVRVILSRDLVLEPYGS